MFIQSRKENLLVIPLACNRHIAFGYVKLMCHPHIQNGLDNLVVHTVPQGLSDIPNNEIVSAL